MSIRYEHWYVQRNHTRLLDILTRLGKNGPDCKAGQVLLRYTEIVVNHLILGLSTKPGLFPWDPWSPMDPQRPNGMGGFHILHVVKKFGMLIWDVENTLLSYLEEIFKSWYNGYPRYSSSCSALTASGHGGCCPSILSYHIIPYISCL